MGDSQDGLCFNGINGANGDYLSPSLSPAAIAKIAADEPLDPDEIEELRIRLSGIREKQFAPIPGVQLEDLSKAGWGVIFAPDVTDAEKEALAPLLRMRQEQAGVLYTDFPGTRAFQADDSKYSFLGRSGAGPGPVDPKKIPYYLLLVGSPNSIPFSFQYQLDVAYAVGRIHFDTAAEYSSYARAVVAAEFNRAEFTRQLPFFGVRNEDDSATQLSADLLIKPLEAALRTDEFSTWNSRCVLGAMATRDNLASVLLGGQAPSLLVTASHGLGFPNGDSRQVRQQGALLCQDWPGPEEHRGPIPENYYLAADHISGSANLQGMIAFFFACYGGGTPRSDEFAHLIPGPQRDLAPFPFVGALPKRLLGHERGGALAVIGHVERAWSYSFVWPQAGQQLAVFQSTIGELLRGKRVGDAMEYFSARFAELSTDLTEELKDRKFRRRKSESQSLAQDKVLAGLWTANNDARSYVVLGDPAVRLPAAPIS